MGTGLNGCGSIGTYRPGQSTKVKPQFKLGDKVWLSLENIPTKWPSKKFDSKNAKYTVLEVVG
jgi:hypothetical protein